MAAIEQQVLKGEVTKNISVLLKSTREEKALNKPLYAINWFSTKVAWMYHFYNFLALPRVKSIGGKVFFKGKIYQSLHGEESDSRNLLLIVRYPSGKKFITLMKDFLFKAVSIFRILSVKDFSFGFTKKLFPFDNKTTLDKTQKYAIHHFKTKNFEEVDIIELQKILDDIDVELHYAGLINAKLYSQEKDKAQEQIPCLMDGILLFRSETLYCINRLFDSKAYQQFMAQFDSSYIGLVKRTK